MNKKEANRAEADTSSKTIADLKHAIKELVSGRKRPEELEGIIAEAKTLARDWTNPHSAQNPKDRRPLFDGTCNDRTLLLAGLVVALSRDHELVARIRRHFPGELEKLSRDSSYADAAAVASACPSTRPEPAPKRKYERKRRRWRRGDKGEIERQFGRYTSAVSTPSALSPFLLPVPYPADCLDEIFCGGGVNMLRLEELFGIERHRLAKLVDHEDKKRRKYGHRAVVKIMDASLTKGPRKKRKRSTPGRPRQLPWLNDPDLRTRVFSGVEARINSISMPEHIKSAFLAVVHRHLPDSGKK